MIDRTQIDKKRGLERELWWRLEMELEKIRNADTKDEYDVAWDRRTATIKAIGELGEREHELWLERYHEQGGQPGWVK